MNRRTMGRRTGVETVEDWARRYVSSTRLADKLRPPPPPSGWSAVRTPERLTHPGRPPELAPMRTGVRAHRGKLGSPSARARLFHTFFHHELQAAELMCWAILAFPETSEKFRSGLVRICLDEVRHMNLYRAHIERLGHHIGDFPVRDWFWERLAACESPVHFVAAMGMGFEAGNLEHSARFAELYRKVGDEEGARIQERVGAEEVGHVRFAVHWFETWTGDRRFDTWLRHLPPPLSPMVMRGAPFRRDVRLSAGFSADFIDALETWQPT